MCKVFMPISAARWVGDGAPIRPSAKIVRLIGDLNSFCSFGGSNFNIYECLGATTKNEISSRKEEGTEVVNQNQ